MLLKMKLFKTKFKWNWKQNQTKLETKFKTKFKQIWEWNSNKISNKIQMNFKQNWKGNPIQNEIQTASCAPKRSSFMVAGDLSSHH
jgi:hypothetical protein